MIIQGERVTREDVKVQVSPTEAWGAVKTELLRLAGIRVNWYLRDRNGQKVFMKDEDYYHGSISEEFVQNATPEQVELFEAIQDFELRVKPNVSATWIQK